MKTSTFRCATVLFALSLFGAPSSAAASRSANAHKVRPAKRAAKKSLLHGVAERLWHRTGLVGLDNTADKGHAMPLGNHVKKMAATGYEVKNARMNGTYEMGTENLVTATDPKGTTRSLRLDNHVSVTPLGVFASRSLRATTATKDGQTFEKEGSKTRGVHHRKHTFRVSARKARELRRLLGVEKLEAGDQVTYTYQKTEGGTFRRVHASFEKVGLPERIYFPEKK